MSRTVFRISLLVVLAVGILFLAFPGSLLYPLVSDPYVPAGTLVTWTGFIALAVCAYTAVNRFTDPEDRIDRMAGMVLKFLIILAVLWLPFVRILSGNWAGNFDADSGYIGSQEAYVLYWNAIRFLAAAPVAVLIVYGLARWARRLLSKA